MGPFDGCRLIVWFPASVHRASRLTAQRSRGIAAQRPAVVRGVGAELLVLEVEHGQGDVQVLGLGGDVVGGAHAAGTSHARGFHKHKRFC